MAFEVWTFLNWILTKEKRRTEEMILKLVDKHNSTYIIVFVEQGAALAGVKPVWTKFEVCDEWFLFGLAKVIWVVGKEVRRDAFGMIQFLN